jgi:hypothetical protein
MWSPMLKFWRFEDNRITYTESKNYPLTPRKLSQFFFRPGAFLVLVFKIIDFYDFSFQFLIFKILIFPAFAIQDFNIIPKFQ